MATTQQVNDIATMARRLAGDARRLEEDARRLVEAWNEIGVSDYLADGTNVDPATGLLLEMQAIAPADLLAVHFLAERYMAFMRGGLDDTAKAEFWRTAARVQPLGR
jgi:hypothetical protein